MLCASGSACVTTPLEVVRVQFQTDVKHKFSNFRAVLTRIGQREQMRGRSIVQGLFAGCYYRMSWSALNTGAVVGLYDTLRLS